MWDAGFRAPLLSSVTKAGAAVEEAFGGVPQDVEGVWVDGVLTVVQARPQVGRAHSGCYSGALQRP